MFIVQSSNENAAYPALLTSVQIIQANPTFKASAVL